MVRERRGEGLQLGLEKKAVPLPMPVGAGQATEIRHGRQGHKTEDVGVCTKLKGAGPVE